MIFDTDEIAVDGCWVERETDECVDDGSFGDDFECPFLFFIEIVSVY